VESKDVLLLVLSVQHVKDNTCFSVNDRLAVIVAAVNGRGWLNVSIRCTDESTPCMPICIEHTAVIMPVMV